MDYQKPIRKKPDMLKSARKIIAADRSSEAEESGNTNFSLKLWE